MDAVLTNALLEQMMLTNSMLEIIAVEAGAQREQAEKQTTHLASLAKSLEYIAAIYVHPH